MRGSLLVLALLLTTSLAAPALAQPREFGAAPEDVVAGGKISRLETTDRFIEEYCPVARYVCVGPYRIDRVTVEFGETGGVVRTNNTTLTGFYDTERRQRYGPYIVQMPVTDDIRVCYFTCDLPHPAYARFEGTVRLELYVLGGRITDRNVTANATLGSDAGWPLPPPFGCDRWQTYCE